MEANDISYAVGRLIGAPLLALIISYLFVRLVKKRKPTGKDWGIIAAICVMVFLFSSVARVINSY